MNVKIVGIEDQLVLIGTRKVAAHVKTLHDAVSTYYIPVGYTFSPATLLTGKRGGSAHAQVDRIAEQLATDADVIGISSMSNDAAFTENLIRSIKRVNPNVFVVWGGIHPIIDPENAIRRGPDAVCTGEGELAFGELVESLRDGKDFSNTANMWFRSNGSVQRNPFRPLLTSDEMSKMPLMDYATDTEHIFNLQESTFEKATSKHYLQHNNTSYGTIFSIGCAFKCNFCGNTKFLENHSNYSKLRHPGADYICREIEQAVRTHKHIGTITFMDDLFFALPLETIYEFTREYKRRIGLPLVIIGAQPNVIQEEKVDLLVDAGMTRVRMGIQTGSERIMKFYKRPAPPEQCMRAARVFNRFKGYMQPPTYDLITDNPIATKDDVDESLRFFYDLPKPYCLNVYSLRLMPNTHMVEDIKKFNVDIDDIEKGKGYYTVAPTLENIAIYLIATFPLPRPVFEWLLKRCRPVTEKQTQLPILTTVAFTLFLVRRALSSMYRMDFNQTSGKFGYFLKSIGVVKLWHKLILKEWTSKFVAPADPSGWKKIKSFNTAASEMRNAEKIPPIVSEAQQVDRPGAQPGP